MPLVSLEYLHPNLAQALRHCLETTVLKWQFQRSPQINVLIFTKAQSDHVLVSVVAWLGWQRLQIVNYTFLYVASDLTRLTVTLLLSIPFCCYHVTGDIKEKTHMEHITISIITCCIQGCREGQLGICLAKDWELSERNSISITVILSTRILWGTSVECMTGSTRCYSTVSIARFHPCPVEDTVGHPSTSLGLWVTTWSASVALITWGM